jgi:glycosyltransferase involved in cell wall biosynthesis
MNELIDLKVVFLLKDRNWRNWSAPNSVTWAFEFMGFRSIKIKEFEFVPEFFGVKRILDSTDVVIVGSWEMPFYISSIMRAKRAGIPIVQLYESTPNSQKFQKGMVSKIRSYLLGKADLVVTFGAESSRAVIAMGITQEKILELFNPADVSYFHRMSLKVDKQEDRGHKFIFVGQLISRKNIDSLIHAFSLMREEGDSLFIVGDGRSLDELKGLVAQLELSNHVFFQGHLSREELADAFSRSNTLILPSSNEVWGLVVNEALACGLNVVVSDQCGVAALVKNMSGTFVCGTTYDSIAKQMQKSRMSWAGWNDNPEILNYTPEIFGEMLTSAIGDLVKRSFPQI